MTPQLRRRNARIIATRLGFEGHGIFTFSLQVDFGGSGMWIGGHGLSHKDPSTGGDVVNHHAGDLVVGILRALQVDAWEDLAGVPVVVVFDGDRVRGLQNILDPGIGVDFLGFFGS